MPYGLVVSSWYCGVTRSTALSVEFSSSRTNSGVSTNARARLLNASTSLLLSASCLTVTHRNEIPSRGVETMGVRLPPTTMVDAWSCGEALTVTDSMSS